MQGHNTASERILSQGRWFVLFLPSSSSVLPPTLDIKILRAAFQSYSDLPSTIPPRVENVVTGYSVDNDFQKRAKYLVHLPYGSEIVSLECDCIYIASAEVLKTFSIEIDQRRQRKREKDSRKSVPG